MKNVDIKEKVGADTISKKEGVYTIRRSYFYSHGFDQNKFAEGVLRQFPNAKIIDSGNHYASFRGCDSVAKGSHFWVKFILNENE